MGGKNKEDHGGTTRSADKKDRNNLPLVKFIRTKKDQKNPHKKTTHTHKTKKKRKHPQTPGKQVWEGNAGNRLYSAPGEQDEQEGGWERKRPVGSSIFGE